jgi:hypothetical protein
VAIGIRRQLPSYIFLTPFVRPIFPELRELCGSISLNGLHCSPFATCGVENPRYYDGGQASALWRAPKTPTLLDVLGVRGSLKLQIKNALFRECWTRAYELQRHRHAYRWGWHHHVKAKSCH